MTRSSLLFVGILGMNVVLSSSGWTHGEDKAGPHGGVIRMPGAFHTEIKEIDKSTFELYVLDMEWKNPVVQDSTLSAKWKAKDKNEVSLSCRPKQKRFICSLPGGALLNSGDIVTVLATRNGMPGAPVTYEYPFKGARGGH